MQHRLVGGDVFGFGLLAFRLQIWLDLIDLVPEGVKVDHQVFNNRHVTCRLNGDDTVFNGSSCLSLTGQTGMSVDADSTGTTDGAPARATKAERTVGVFSDLDKCIQHRAVVFDRDLEFLPIRLRISNFRVEPLYV